MIKQVNGEYVAECSGCGAEEYGGCIESFREFVSWLKDEGWKIKKDEDEWLHICPSCRE
jgi:hypothetical protein